MAWASSGCGGAPGAQPPHTSTRANASAASPTAPAFPGFIDPVGIAFDRQGRSWVADYRRDSLSLLPAADLAARGRTQVHPSAVISPAGGPNQLRFDRNGTLWVAGWGQGTILGYSPEALAAGSPRPTVIIEGPSLDQPTDIAFDRRGTMWVANQGTGAIVAYAADQLRDGGRLQPIVTLRVPGFGDDSPEALAFDRSGRLWVSSYYDDLVVGLAPSQLRSASPSPSFRIQLPSDSGPIGLTVDRMGRLWVAEASSSEVAALDLTHPGRRPVPVIVLKGDAVHMPHSVTFDAADNAWLPCYNGTVARFDASRVRPGTIEGADLIAT
jgi:sugar lactone lactonase YvrE